MTELDHDDELTFAEQLTEQEQVYFPLFAEALDPDSPVTIEDVEQEWNQ